MQQGECRKKKKQVDGYHTGNVPECILVEYASSGPLTPIHRAQSGKQTAAAAAMQGDSTVISAIKYYTGVSGLSSEKERWPAGSPESNSCCRIDFFL